MRGGSGQAGREGGEGGSKSSVSLSVGGEREEGRGTVVEEDEEEATASQVGADKGEEIMWLGWEE